MISAFLFSAFCCFANRTSSPLCSLLEFYASKATKYASFISGYETNFEIYVPNLEIYATKLQIYALYSYAYVPKINDLSHRARLCDPYRFYGPIMFVNAPQNNYMNPLEEGMLQKLLK